MLLSILSHPQKRHLMWQMAKRELVLRYRGSMFGALWSILTPLLMLALYSFVFGFIMKVRWQGLENPSPFAYAGILYCGLIFHQFLIDVMAKSPSLVLANANLIKKTSFPAEILSISAGLASLIQFALNAVILAIILCAAHLNIGWQIFQITPTLLGFVLVALGISWFFSAIGVWIRDINHMIPLLATILLFFSPVFYPIANLPHCIKTLIYLNPISWPVEALRALILSPEKNIFLNGCFYLCYGIAISWIGSLCFKRLQKRFADFI